MKKIELNPLLFPIQFLWLFILMPKEMQFLLYAFVIVLIFIKYGIRFDKTSLILLIVPLIQIIAIICQVVIMPYDFTVVRMLAGFNTALIWVLAILYFSLIRNSQKSLISKVSKYMLINLIILFFIYILSLYVKVDEFTLLGYSWRFRRDDWLITGKTTRFCGLMESVLGPSHLYCFALPISLLCIKKIKYFFVKFILPIAFYIPIYASHSRIGTLVCFFIMLIGLFYLIVEHFKMSKINIVFVLFTSISLASILLLINRELILNEFIDFFNSRSGSNNSRFTIYEESIRYTLDNNALFGIGIKYMLGDFPYGSHCTYIGIFYKTGLLGILFFIVGFIVLFKEFFKSINNVFIFLALLLVTVLFIFADIDGADWYIMSYFGVWAVFINQGKERNYLNENTNSKFCYI